MLSWQGLPVSLKDNCAVICVLKRTSEKEIILLQEKSSGRQLLLRNFPHPIPDVYELLNGKVLPYVPATLSVGPREGGSYVLTEYIEGKLLDGVSPDAAELNKILRCVCTALTALHDLGIVHRDVKPENIILSDNGEAYLIDLDAARIYKSSSMHDTNLLGTAGFAAPEQFGIVQTDHRADIFALGITLNVLLTGSHPTEKLCTGPMRHVILKCTQIEPNSRYQSAAEVLKAAERAVLLMNLERYKKHLCMGVIAAGLALAAGVYSLHSTSAEDTPDNEIQIHSSAMQTAPLAPNVRPEFDSSQSLVPYVSPVVPQDSADSGPSRPVESAPIETPSPSSPPDFMSEPSPGPGLDLHSSPAPDPVIGPVEPSVSPRPTSHPLDTPTPKPLPTPSPRPTSNPTPKPTPKPSPSAAPVPTATPTPAPPPTPTAAPTPVPSSPSTPEGYDEALALKQEYDRRGAIYLEASDKYYAWIEGPYNQKYKQYQAACDEQDRICEDCHIETVLKQENLQELQQNDPDNTEAINSAQAEYDEARRIEEEANAQAKPAQDAQYNYLNSSEYLIGKREEERLWNDMQQKNNATGEILVQLNEVKDKYNLWHFPEL